MSEKFTDSQRLAIDSRGGGILVGAAAGSGKTSVLVERIISLITDEKNPVDADKLLVVTFTNAAAAEMGARIKKSLSQLIAKNPTDRRLRRQQILLCRANISTIHAFCSSVLREHFSQIDISPDFSLGNEAYVSQLRAKAMDETLNALYSNQSSGIEQFSDLFGRSRTDQNTADLIERLYDFQTTLAHPKKWENDCLDELKSVMTLGQTRTSVYLLSYAKQALEAGVSLCTEALVLAGEEEVLFKNYGDALYYDMEYIKSLLYLVCISDWDACAAMANSYCPKSVGTKRCADVVLKNVVKSLMDRVKDIIDEICTSCFSYTQDENLVDKQLMLKPTEILFDALDRFRERLLELKKEKKIFEFSDLERMTLSLLSGENGAKSGIANELSTQFEYILVDEYQDTNEIQELMFSLISRDQKNIFCVGDVKQSIYSFRRADPEIFLARRASSRDSAQGLYPMRITLAENFRSSKAVIDSVNAVFEPIMGRLVGGTSYAEGEQLVASKFASNQEACGLEIHLIAREAGSEQSHIATEISKLLGEGYVLETKDGKRPCRPSDFCILLRSPKNKAESYKAALELAGVHAWTDGANNLYENSEVAVLLSLLRVVDNPRRDVELAAVMMSPLFGFSSDDMIRLKISDKRQNLYALVLSSPEKKCKDFVKAIAHFRLKQSIFAVDELVQYIVDYTDAEILLCAGEELTRRRNNIRFFIESAAEISRAGEGSLSLFLRMCEREAQSNKIESRAFTPPDDAVCITSIHKSKGLEWGIIFLANAEKRFNLGDSYDSSMLFDASLGCGARIRTECADKSALYSRKTLDYCALSLSASAKTTSEEMRVLYVALTRARQKLFVTAVLNKPYEKIDSLMACVSNSMVEPYIVASQNGYLPWVMLGVLCKYGTSVVRAINTSNEFCADGIRICVVNEVVETQQSQLQNQSVVVEQKDLDELNRRAQYKYSRLELADVPTKLTVTELAKEGSSVILNKPHFARKAMSASQRGTAIHLFMQCAIYKNAQISVKAELGRLVEKSYITEQAAAEIDINKLEYLFNSEFGKMIANEKNVLREYAFIDLVSASLVKPLSEEFNDERIMVQGIADCIVMLKDHAILIDYKSDRVDSPKQLIDRYSLQLKLYKAALDKRLSLPITKSVIYSFELGVPIEIEL